MSGSSPTPPKLRQSAQRRLAHPRTQTTRRWADAVAKSLVDGGLNPRISGGGPKVGTNFAVDLLAGRMRDDRPLSTPQAAGGGGQRPAFTGVYRPARIVNR